VAFNVPALVANTWHYHRIAINPDDARHLTAVVTVVLRQVVDIGAATLWVDDVRAAENSSARWEGIPAEWWSIDKEAGEIVLKPEWGTPPYNLLKITGGDKPVLLNADATVSEVDPSFVIAYATHLLLLATGGRSDVDPEARRSLAGYWKGEADKRARAFPKKQNWRDVA
jgi:DICT domain-containing protein